MVSLSVFKTMGAQSDMFGEGKKRENIEHKSDFLTSQSSTRAKKPPNLNIVSVQPHFILIFHSVGIPYMTHLHIWDQTAI